LKAQQEKRLDAFKSLNDGKSTKCFQPAKNLQFAGVA